MHSRGRLIALPLVQAILPKAAVEVINKLLLQLLVDSGFKRQFGQVYAITYEHLAAENRVALFNFSVQFLNRESYVRCADR